MISQNNWIFWIYDSHINVFSHFTAESAPEESQTL